MGFYSKMLVQSANECKDTRRSLHKMAYDSLSIANYVLVTAISLLLMRPYAYVKGRYMYVALPVCLAVSTRWQLNVKAVNFDG